LPVQSISGAEITVSQPARDNNTRSRDTVQNSFLFVTGASVFVPAVTFAVVPVWAP
jgi:hypothetical protein